MKVLYITIPAYFDLEISLIRELSLHVDIKVLMIINKDSMNSSAFSIDHLYENTEIIPATDYPGLEKYRRFIDLDRWFIANNSSKTFFDCWNLSKLIKSFIINGEYDMIHNTTFAKELILLLPLFYFKKNKIMTIHDPIPHDKLSIIGNIRLRLFHFAFHNILLLNNIMEQDFCTKFRINKERIYYSHLSVYDFLRKYEIGYNKYGKYILFFGRIAKYKGVENLIDAYILSELPAKGIKMVIAGNGFINNEKCYSDNNIILLNKHISNDELSNLIYHCQFVVLPYLSATQSGCVMSAFAFNKPILATRVGALPNEIIDNVTGVLCNPNDIDDLGLKLNKMIDSDLTQLEKNINNIYQDNGDRSWSHASEYILHSYNCIWNQ